MKNVQDMTITEMIKRIEQLEKENFKLKKYKISSERNVFDSIPEEQKKLFEFTCNSNTGQIVNGATLDVRNDNFKVLYIGILKTIFPEMKTYKSNKGKFQKSYKTFNDMTSDEFKIIKMLIVNVVERIFEAKKQLKEAEE